MLMNFMWWARFNVHSFHDFLFLFGAALLHVPVSTLFYLLLKKRNDCFAFFFATLPCFLDASARKLWYIHVCVCALFSPRYFSVESWRKVEKNILIHIGVLDTILYVCGLSSFVWVQLEFGRFVYISVFTI